MPVVVEAGEVKKAAQDLNRFLNTLSGLVSLQKVLADAASMLGAAAEAKTALKTVTDQLADARVAYANEMERSGQVRAAASAFRDEQEAIVRKAAGDHLTKVKAFEDAKLAYEQELAVRTDAVRTREAAAKVREEALGELHVTLNTGLAELEARTAVLVSRETKLKEALS